MGTKSKNYNILYVIVVTTLLVTTFFMQRESAVPPFIFWQKEIAGEIIKFYRNDNKVYAVSKSGELFVSADLAETWIIENSWAKFLIDEDSIADIKFAGETPLILTGNGDFVRVEQGEVDFSSVIMINELYKCSAIDYISEEIIYAAVSQFSEMLPDGTFESEELWVQKGSESWQSKKTPFTNIRAISFQDPDNGLVLTNSGLYATTNCGESWDVVEDSLSNTFTSINVISPRFILASTSGNSFYCSNDNGESWNRIDFPVSGATITSLSFLNEEQGIAVGENGLVFFTSNGGSTWKPLDSAITENLHAVYFLDPETAIIAGENGTLLKMVTF